MPCRVTCKPDGAAVNAPPEPGLVAERRSPVSLTVAVLVVVAHLQCIKKKVKCNNQTSQFYLPL